MTHRHAVDWELNESEMWNILWWINTDTGRRKGECIYILKPLRHFRISHPISFNSLNNRCNYLAHSDFQLFGMRDLLNLVSSNWQHMQKVKCSEKCNFFPSIAVLGNSATDRDVTMRCKKSVKNDTNLWQFASLEKKNKKTKQTVSHFKV